VEEHHYRIGKNRALFMVNRMVFLAATVICFMTYPTWVGVGEDRALSLFAMAEGQVDIFDKAQREAVGDVLRKHGVSRKPGQDWMQVFQGLSASKISEIAGDLQKKLENSLSDTPTNTERRQARRAPNSVQGRTRHFAGGTVALPGVMAVP
jgi:hypothetical protein